MPASGQGRDGDVPGTSSGGTESPSYAVAARLGPLHSGAPRGREQSDRAASRWATGLIEWDLTFLMAVLNWAARSKDEHGPPAPRLRNPAEEASGSRGRRTPTGSLLTRGRSTEALLEGVGGRSDWRFHVALVLAHETGTPDRRDSATCRWSGIDPEAGIWRNHLTLRDSPVEFPLIDSRQMRF